MHVANQEENKDDKDGEDDKDDEYDEDDEDGKDGNDEFIDNQEPENEYRFNEEAMYIDPADLPPESAVDMDSDGALVGLENDHDDEMDEPYNNKEDINQLEEDGSVSDNSEKYKDLKKKRVKKKKVRSGL